MRILSLDLSKYKTVACDYEAETGRHQFATVLTTPKGLHDLIVDRDPDRVVIEICSAGCVTWCEVWGLRCRWPARMTSGGNGAR